MVGDEVDGCVAVHGTVPFRLRWDGFLAVLCEQRWVMVMETANGTLAMPECSADKQKGG